MGEITVNEIVNKVAEAIDPNGMAWVEKTMLSDIHHPALSLTVDRVKGKARAAIAVLLDVDEAFYEQAAEQSGMKPAAVRAAYRAVMDVIASTSFPQINPPAVSAEEGEGK